MLPIASLLLLALLYPAAAFSQPVIFDHRPEDRKFLQYYYLWNQFDSSVVMYEFGEVTFLGEARQHIPLSTLVQDGQKLQGAGTQGINTDLQLLARTEDFTIPGAGTIQWFGRLQAFRTPCNKLSGRQEEPNRPTPAWGIVDRTEFVIQLVDAGSGVVLSTLDSTGVRPTEAVPPIADTRYGTAVEQVVHIANIPAAFTDRTVYVRISPRRYGPTPFGLAMSRYSSWINLSAEYDSTGTSQISLAQTESLRDLWFTTLVAYCDSVKAQTGWLPDLHGISFAKESHLALYHSRYFEAGVDANGDTLWMEKHTMPASKHSAGTTRITGAVSIAPLARITAIAPNPIVSENASISILVGIDMNARLELISLDGRRLGTLWSGFLRLGRHSLTVPVPADIPNGSSILVLENENGERIHQEPLVLTR